MHKRRRMKAIRIKQRIKAKAKKRNRVNSGTSQPTTGAAGAGS